MWTTWRAATQDALYGQGGFYARGERPAAHFRTSVHASPRYAGAILALLRHADAALGHPDRLDLVDIGAGQGELLSQVLALAQHLPAGPAADGPGLSFPQRIVPRAVEIAPRSPGCDDRIRWSQALPARIRGLVIASEWLDNIPVDVAELTPDGPRIVLVDPGSGAERTGPPAGPAEQDWLRRWWPLHHPGDRAELGHPRCAAWAGRDRAARRRPRPGRGLRALAGGQAAGRDPGRVPGRPGGAADPGRVTGHHRPCGPGRLRGGRDRGRRHPDPAHHPAAGPAGAGADRPPAAAEPGRPGPGRLPDRAARGRGGGGADRPGRARRVRLADPGGGRAAARRAGRPGAARGPGRPPGSDTMERMAQRQAEAVTSSWAARPGPGPGPRLGRGRRPGRAATRTAATC